MAKVNGPDYDLLRAKVKNIIIEDNLAGEGFIIKLRLKDGDQKAYPEAFQSPEVLVIASELGRMLHLPESAILIKTGSIDKNLLSDIYTAKFYRGLH